MELQILTDSQVIERTVAKLFSQRGNHFTPSEIQDIFREQGFWVRLDAIKLAMIHLFQQGRITLTGDEWRDEIKRLTGEGQSAVQRRKPGTTYKRRLKRRYAKRRSKGPASTSEGGATGPPHG